MKLDTQTTIFMICLVYLILHGAIWFALQEYRSQQVKLWCLSGIVSGLAVVLLSMRGVVSEFVFFYIAQLLMLAGNWGRMVALRMYLLPEPQSRALLAYHVANTLYFCVFCVLIALWNAEWEALMLFNGFYALLCFDYFRIGLKLFRRQSTLGAKLLMWAGLTFTVTLGVRTVGVASAGTIDDLYAPSWHQGILVIGQFIAITLSNIAFLRIFLEIAERKKLEIAHELRVSNERADAMHRSSLNLKQLLDEREEIIRQLSIFNKTAGMGALVASLAHELNQPLTVIQMNTEMIDLVINNQNIPLNENVDIQNAMDGLKKANQRAATIIQTLRNMFRHGNRTVSTFDFNDLVHEVVLISTSTLQRQRIDIQVALCHQPLQITGDKSQLQQVLLNLVTNASEAFPEHFLRAKTIDIRTSLHAGYFELTVRDNGTGISPEIEENIFELLRTNKESGMGIGLWLSKTIVESHRGSIHFTTSNEGTCFTLHLPIEVEPSLTIVKNS